jgi:formate dehydrogenase subunit gamma
VTSATGPHVAATTLLRFDRVQRTAHWLNALLFGTLMFTAIPLYFGSFFGAVFPRHVIQEIHLWAGLALPLPIVVAMSGPWGQRMRQDLRRFSLWTRDEVRWMRTMGRTSLRADKFNPGQKANAIFVGASIVILLASGVILQWFRFFPVSWRGGATFTHDVLAWAIFIVVIGHVMVALAHPAALKSMFKGTVSGAWAKRNAPSWWEEHAATGDLEPDRAPAPRRSSNEPRDRSLAP